ncbi:hypothetical protein K501DRAFT_323634 [Backusella circina FSU 941]|nr:hypothetical protein K501DRAFT_323634 [Backusella circina FSU 941]
MVSIFNAIRQDNIDVLKHLIALTTGETITAAPSCITKEDSQWIQQRWRQGSKQFDLNKRSTKGRTPLHCAATWNRVQIAQLLIECPQVGVNIKDSENGWTALHRALYNGNIEIAKMLLDREDIDVTIKDNEGYTAFEIYNSTISDTFPTPKQITGNNNKSFSGGTDVYTWGSNTNYVLGHPDSEGRTRPERVNTQLDSQRTSLIMMRPDYVIESVTMSKYHTAILTSEPVNNLLMCGFGRGGRLGISREIETQLIPAPVKWPERIVSIALGRDHSIAVTESGNVLSFGSNEFGQLGYELESRSKDEHPMQLVPRKIQAQNLKKQSILGVAASRIHSVVYTSTDIFTFGLNQGQLGYHQPDSEQCQFIPRKVTISSEIVQVVVNDNATAILNKSHEVILLHNFNQQKIIFPMNRFPNNIQVHTPAANYIVKLIGSGTDYLGAISNTGDVFVWTCKAPRMSSASSMNEQHQKSKQSSHLISAPKRIWTLRKAHLAASDASLGQYGELIVCTVSGHVFIGQPSREKATGYKFSQVPFLQRCIQVYANPSGAFAALRSEYTIDLPDIPSSTVIQDIAASLPHRSIQDKLKEKITSLKSEMEQEIIRQNQIIMKDNANEEYLESRLKNVEKTFGKRLNDIVEDAWHDVQVESIKDHALDVVFRVHSRDIYCHSAMIRCRSPSFFKQLIHMEDYQNAKFKFKVRKHFDNRILVQIDHCELASILLLLDYLYADVFDHPMKAYFEMPSLSLTSIDDQQMIKKVPVKLVMVQKDLVGLAEFFQLPHLVSSARASFHNAPVPTLKSDLKYLLEHEKGVDITLNTKGNDAQNGNLKCHEFILRQRSAFFKNLLLPESVWMEKRRSRQVEEGETKMATLKLDMISSETMQVILSYIYMDQPNIFDGISKENEEAMLRFLLDVLSESDALLLYRLKSITGKHLIRFIKLRTACMILSYAHVHLAEKLKSACMKFITANLPIYLNSSMLDDLPISLFRELEHFIKSTQGIPSMQPCNDTPTEIEDDEFSTSLYALSKNDNCVSPYLDILVTLYPEKLSLEDVVVDSSYRDNKKPAAIDTKKKKIVNSNQLNTIPKEKLPPLTTINPAGWMTDSLESVSVPSLREILDAEPASAALNAAKNTKHATVKKKSQKERRKIHQQELAAATQSDSAQKSVWGKVEPAKPVSISEATSSSVPKVVDSDKKGKKIYVSDEEILDKQDLRKLDLGREEGAFDPTLCFGSTFKLTSICRPNNKKQSAKTNKEQSSFETIQKQQELEDKWLKGNRPKKNILRIQKEEQAVKDLAQHYIQALDVMTGEWIDVRRVEAFL